MRVGQNADWTVPEATERVILGRAQRAAPCPVIKAPQFMSFLSAEPTPFDLHTSRFFGQPSDITLYAFGGFATAYPFHGTWRNVAVVAAGPLVSFSTGGLAYLAMIGLFNFPQWLPEDEQVVENILYFLFCLQFQGIGWGLLNSIPIYPLDGGQITRYLFVRFRPWDGVSLSLKLSLLLAIIFGVLAFQRQDTMWGLFMLSFAMNNWQELQMTRR